MKGNYHIILLLPMIEKRQISRKISPILYKLESILKPPNEVKYHKIYLNQLNLQINRYLNKDVQGKKGTDLKINKLINLLEEILKTISLIQIQ